MERVDAELHGWPAGAVPDEGRRRRLVQATARPGARPVLGRRRCGSASRRTTSSTWPGAWCGPSGWAPRDRLELEMLEGMAPGEAEAVRAPGRAASCCTRRSCGATSSTPRSPTSCAGSTRTPAPTTSCATSSTCAPGSGRVRRSARPVPATRSRGPARRRPDVPPGAGPRRPSTAPVRPRRSRSRNEPDTDWSLAARTASGSTGRSRRPGGRRRGGAGRGRWRRARARGGAGRQRGSGSIPPRPTVPLYRYALADRALVDRAVDAAAAGAAGLGSRPDRRRACRAARAVCRGARRRAAARPSR